VESELRPGDDFEEFVQSTEPSRKSNERIRKVGHKRLPRVHTIHHVQLIEPRVSYLSLGEPAGNDTHDLSSGSESGIRHLTHEADFPAAIDESDMPSREALGNSSCSLHVSRPLSSARSAKDTNAVNRPVHAFQLANLP
jgi:hypothetical protein